MLDDGADEADKDTDNNAMDGPTVLAHVELARKACKCFWLIFYALTYELRCRSPNSHCSSCYGNQPASPH